MAERQCEACGRLMEAKRSTKRFCSSTCRVHASQGTVIPLQPQTDASAGLLTTAVRAELDAVERAGSALGVAALVLAGRIDSGSEPGSALSGLSRELRATLAEATRGTVRSSVAQMRDELAARRKQA